MLRSMYSGISGMKNFQTKLDVIGNNIANVNTYGYKKGRVTFKDTMNQTISGASASQGNKGGKNPMQVGLGSTFASVDTIHSQSSLQTTGRPLDLAVTGDGYFVVKQGTAQFYSRAGNFYLDDDGALVNADGMKVQAFNNGSLEDIVVNVNSLMPAKQTTKIDMTGNLPTDAKGSSKLVQQLKVVDDKGEEHVLDIAITPNDALKGQWTFTMADKTLVPAQNTTVTVDLATGVLTPANPAVPLNGNGTPFPFSLNIGGLTMSPGSLDATGIADGNTQGALESFTIGSYGEINGVFSNGLVTELGKLALAKFSNPTGLTKAGNNLFQDSVNSGTANIDVAGEGRGTIASGSLEMSNVDLSEEFTEMITAQRGFQANTRIITTSDEILQELVNLKR